jgi:hypothetical protein
MRRVEASRDGKEKQEHQDGENDGKGLAALIGDFPKLPLCRLRLVGDYRPSHIRIDPVVPGAHGCLQAASSRSNSASRCPRCGRAKMRTKAFRRSRDERTRVEMRFAHLKTHHAFERLRLRGLSGARDEFHLAAIVQNLKTMALRLLSAPPNHATA